MFTFWNEQHTKTAVASAQLIFGFATLYIAFTKDATSFLLPATLCIAHAICKLGEGDESVSHTAGVNAPTPPSLKSSLK